METTTISAHPEVHVRPFLRIFLFVLLAAICGGLITVGMSSRVVKQHNLAHDFATGKLCRNFAHSSLHVNPDGELVINEPSEVKALTEVFQRSDKIALRSKRDFNMEITFAGGRHGACTVYAVKDGQPGFVAAFPFDDGSGSVQTKNVIVDPKEMPEPLLAKLRAFGLLARHSQ